MPVACASAPGGGTAPANAATSTAASRRMLVSLPRFRGRRQTGTHPGGHRSRSQKATRPAHSVDGPRQTAGSEADATREDEGLTPTDFPASLGKRDERAALQLERGATEQVQARLGVGDAGATGRADGRVYDVQAAARVRTKAAPRGHGEPVRDVAVDLPVVEADTARRAGEEVIERDDAIERRLGKQRFQGEDAPAADPEIVIAAPVELHPERRAVRAGGSRPGRRAPLGRELCRGQPDGGEEQETAD